jgi:hypothetical protein
MSSDDLLGASLPVSVSPSVSSLERILTRIADQAAVPTPEPIRAIHHLACTGGTLISRALAVMPNVVLMSEIDPLSPLDRTPAGQNPPFRPLDVLHAARAATRPADSKVLERSFFATITALHSALSEKGQRLCIRSHAHSQFHVGAGLADRPTVQDLLTRIAPVRAILTVRHPLDSLMSLRKKDWVHYVPDTAEVYATRYMAFLDAHWSIDILKYEDFVAAPEASMRWLCAQLEVSYDPDFTELMRDVRLSGDSGRRGDVIAPRPRRDVSSALANEVSTSPAFVALCDRLNYELV